jgi:protein-L-isoaspartate(D-aspartate) O-methyltransferase
MSVAYFEQQRREMIAAIRVIAEHLVAEIGKTALDDRVLRAMAKVPRHEFVPIEVQPYAYLNRPLPIGFDKTISQPLMVAVMTDLLELKADDVVLEIGTGLGYQSAVLAELAGKVYTVEIIDELAQQAVQRLKREGYTNTEVRVGNGYFGWPEHAPFDKIIVTAAPDLIPPPLINQLKSGARMVVPVGLPDAQQLLVIDKDMNGKVRTKEIMQVLFSSPTSRFSSHLDHHGRRRFGRQSSRSSIRLEGVGAENRVSGTGLKLLLHARNVAAFAGPPRDCRRFLREIYRYR